MLGEQERDRDSTSGEVRNRLGAVLGGRPRNRATLAEDAEIRARPLVRAVRGAQGIHVRPPTVVSMVAKTRYVSPRRKRLECVKAKSMTVVSGLTSPFQTRKT